ncbi:MAG: NADH-quinone oxidoreductase subunit J [Bdellovibrionales bacterium]
MIISSLAFYLFAGILVVSSLLVITAKNPVHSVLFLILAFFNSAGLFILLGAEFVGMIMVIVYVGSVAVLFLFVVMMLDISFADLRKGAMQYVPIGLIIGAVLLFEFVAVFGSWQLSDDKLSNIASPNPGEEIPNTQALGQVLYTDYVLAFQGAGLILFVAMVGAIVLTHRRRPGVLRQNVGEQHARKPEDVLKVKKVTPRTGV